MPVVTVEIPVQDIARALRKMKKRELETLSLLLTSTGKTLLSRKKDVENKSVPMLSREEVFDV